MSSDAALHSGTFIFYAKNKLHLRAAEDAVSSLSVGTRTAEAGKQANIRVA